MKIKNLLKNIVGIPTFGLSILITLIMLPFIKLYVWWENKKYRRDNL